MGEKYQVRCYGCGRFKSNSDVIKIGEYYYCRDKLNCSKKRKVLNITKEKCSDLRKVLIKNGITKLVDKTVVNRNVDFDVGEIIEDVSEVEEMKIKTKKVIEEVEEEMEDIKEVEEDIKVDTINYDITFTVQLSFKNESESEALALRRVKDSMRKKTYRFGVDDIVETKIVTTKILRS